MAENQAAPSASALEWAFRYTRLGIHLLLAGAKVATGQTPKEVTWARNKATLYRYVPSAQIRFPAPVLLVYALIDRPFILDLIPGNSFVEYLVQQGLMSICSTGGFRAARTGRCCSTTMCSTILPRRSPCSGPASGTCSPPCTPRCSRALICGT